MYLIEDDKCIYDDNIICIDGDCDKCEKRFKKELKNIQKNAECIQISIDELLFNSRIKTQTEIKERGYGNKKYEQKHKTRK